MTRLDISPSTGFSAARGFYFGYGFYGFRYAG